MKFQITVATLATILSAGALTGQEPLQDRKPPVLQNAEQNAPKDQLLSKDQIFAKCLTITSQEEIAIAKYAREKSTSEEVKGLATILEKSHQASLDELKALATKAEAGKKPTGAATAVPSHGGATVDFLQMHQEISDQCLKDCKEMLSKKEGAEFDACFVNMQIAKHSMMHSTLTVLQRHTSGDLQGFIKASLAKNDEHMKAASSLMEKLSDGHLTKTAKASK